jgi:large subunit ribosomal protein L29
MKFEEIKKLSDDKLEKNILAARKEQMNLRFQKASGTLENPNRTRELRKDVARMKTEMTARQSATVAK